MKNKEIRYDEIKKGDVIAWYGAKEIVEEVCVDGMSEYYPSEKVIRFTLRPYDADAEKILGKFYSHGTYGGVGFLTATLIER